jgi:chitodextrinase
MVTSHSANISGLSPAVTYHFRVRSRDGAGNLSLSSNSQFTTASLPDTTAPLSPSGLSATPTSENQIQLSWNTSTDPAGSGQTVSGIRDYQVFRGGTLLGTTASTAYLDTGLTANTTYSYQVTAVDNAGNVSSRSSSVSATTPIFSLPVQRRIIIIPEGAPANQRNLSGTVKFLNPTSGAEVYEASFVANSTGQYVIDVPPSLPPIVNFRIVITGYLSKLLNNIDLRNTNVLDATFPALPAGDFNGDNLINSLDFSYMNGKWAENDSLSDLNKDSVVNSLDFAYLSNNWLRSGE